MAIFNMSCSVMSVEESYKYIDALCNDIITESSVKSIVDKIKNIKDKFVKISKMITEWFKKVFEYFDTQCNAISNFGKNFKSTHGSKFNDKYTNIRYTIIHISEPEHFVRRCTATLRHAVDFTRQILNGSYNPDYFKIDSFDKELCEIFDIRDIHQEFDLNCSHEYGTITSKEIESMVNFLINVKHDKDFFTKTYNDQKRLLDQSIHSTKRFINHIETKLHNGDYVSGYVVDDLDLAYKKLMGANKTIMLMQKYNQYILSSVKYMISCYTTNLKNIVKAHVKHNDSINESYAYSLYEAAMKMF